MSNACSVCRHKSRRDIEAALAGRESLRHIASQFDAGYKAIERHQQNCVPTMLAEVRQVNESRHAMNVQDELARCFHRVNLLFDACQEAWADPERPGKYTLDPHAQDINVIYAEQVGDKQQRKRAKLSTLLARVEGKGMTVEVWESRHADPRELLLKTADDPHGIRSDMRNDSLPCVR